MTLALVSPVFVSQILLACRDLVWGIPTGHHPGPDALFILTVVAISLLLLGIPALIWFMCLWVEVREDELIIRYWPIHKRRISLSEITSCEARTYRPIREYGGWGIRYSWSNGMAYNARGNRGAQLVLSNGKRVLIGSQRSEELAQAIVTAKRVLSTGGMRSDSAHP